MNTVGTLKEINARPGDVVQSKDGMFSSWGDFTVTEIFTDGRFKGQHKMESEAFGTGIFDDHAGTWKIVRRANSGPVRTVTKTELMPGVYGCIEVTGASIADYGSAVMNCPLDSRLIREAIGYLQQIADHLESQE